MESEQDNSTENTSNRIEGKATDPATEAPSSGEKSQKPRWKDRFIHEAQDIFFMVVYLAVSLSLVATFRSLVLIQNGINDFAHAYVVAIVLAIALGKIVALAQKLPIVSALNRQPIALSVLYKSVVMTLLVDIGIHLEERLFPAMSHSAESTTHPLALMITHQISLMFIFAILFTWKDLDRVLGHGTLSKLFFKSSS